LRISNWLELWHQARATCYNFLQDGLQEQDHWSPKRKLRQRLQVHGQSDRRQRLSRSFDDELSWTLTVTPAAWTLAVTALAGTDGIGSVAVTVDVEVTGSDSWLEPRASVMVRDGRFWFLNLLNFLKRRFISLNSELRCSMCSDQVVIRERMLAIT
jgi:hypothetical protein